MTNTPEPGSAPQIHASTEVDRQSERISTRASDISRLTLRAVAQWHDRSVPDAAYSWSMTALATSIVPWSPPCSSGRTAPLR